MVDDPAREHTHMIPRIRIDEDKGIRRFARATGHDFYTQNLPLVVDLFNRTMATHHGEYSLASVQSDLLHGILTADLARRKYRRHKDLVRRALQGLVKGGASRERLKLAQSRLK